MTDLHWLPTIPDWRLRLRALGTDSATAWDEAVALANGRINFVLTNALDEATRRTFPTAPKGLATKPVRLAVLGSSTLTHLLPAIRVAGLRRGIWVDTYEADYGQYLQELADPESGLHAFEPTAVLLTSVDPDATAGLAQVALLRRTDGADPATALAAADAEPESLEAQALAADIELLTGRVDEAFARIIDVVRRTSGPERTAARDHLLSLFLLVGEGDERVTRARTALANALF